MKTLFKLALSLFALSASSTWAASVAVITPYLAQPGTQAAIEGFEASASKKGWEVNVNGVNFLLLSDKNRLIYSLQIPLLNEL